MRRSVVVALLPLASLVAVLPTSSASAVSIAPTPGSPATPVLRWAPCTGPGQAGFECATAKVPLDYQHPQGTHIDLAVMRHTATDRSQRKIGTLFLNPGGPGPSIAQFPTVFYPFFPDKIRQRFDIVTWDPRGTGDSTAVQCFDSEDEEENFLAEIGAGTGVEGAAFPFGGAEQSKWIQAYATLGQLCQQRNPGLLRHVSTTESARDLDLLRAAVGETEINYLGTSYGTFLGATYVNMFPTRVRAVDLDGNVNAMAWVDRQVGINGASYLGTWVRQKSDLGSADTLGVFLDLCGQTDVHHCAFSAGSPSQTSAKFATLMARLQRQPVSDEVTYNTVVSTAVGLLYDSRRGWPYAAQVLEAAWEGKHSLPPPPRPSLSPGPVDLSDPTTATATKYPGVEQPLAIVCGESPNPPLPLLPRNEALSVARSGDPGHLWTWGAEPCSTWPASARAFDRYRGPWNRPTANPVLVINPTHDPATPYQNAQVMAATLANARLLTVNGYGHTALGNPNDCTTATLSAYFIDKTLPPPGASCTSPNPFTGGQ